MSPCKVRAARKEDRIDVMRLVPRLREFGSVAFRSSEMLDAGELRTLNRFFEDPVDGAKLWVAESDAAGIIGAAYAEILTDYFTNEQHAHLGIFMVDGNSEGTGVAGALLERVEQWSADSGFRFLTLNVFAGNDRARAFYQRHHFAPDVVRYIKPVTRNVSPQQGVLDPTLRPTPGKS
jgi:GNAT superfamily N-acetyltransferase